MESIMIIQDPGPVPTQASWQPLRHTTFHYATSNDPPERAHHPSACRGKIPYPQTLLNLVMALVVITLKDSEDQATAGA